MKKKGKQTAAAAAGYVLWAAGWLVLALAIGLVCGALGTWFHHAIELAAAYRQGHPWVIFLLPAAGAATYLLYRLCKVPFDAGTNLILTSVSTGESVPFLLAPLIVAGTTLSHLCGASVGREGAALQLGGAIGHNLAKKLGFGAEGVRTAAMCGMAACFSAMFGTPLTAAVFVLEVIQVGILPYGALFPCLSASYCAHLTARTLGAEPMAFPLGSVPDFTVGNILRVALLAGGCALVSILLCLALEGAAHLAKKVFTNPCLRIIVGGAAMACLVSGLSLYDYVGAGAQIIRRAVAGQAEPWAFLIKLALTALCVGVGFRGGEIVPTLFVGATFGCVAAPWLGLDARFGAYLGMVALFCSVVNCPIASLFLAAELFGTGHLAYFAVVVGVSFVLSGYFGLYSSQVITFSKVRDRELSSEGGG